MMVVEIGSEDHNMDKGMNKYNHQVDVEYIDHHWHILLHYPDKLKLEKNMSYL